MQTAKRGSLRSLLFALLLCGLSQAAESQIPQATAVYGIIATDLI